MPGVEMTTERTASMEDYLEAIAQLRAEETEVRVTQISKRLGVKKPSVTSALHKLSEDGLVKHQRYGHVELTAKGRKVAEEVMRRHDVLFRFLSDVLGVDGETAQDDACRVEPSVPSFFIFCPHSLSSSLPAPGGSRYGSGSSTTTANTESATRRSWPSVCEANASPRRRFFRAHEVSPA
jgi:Mn-dependent DtxR family transcriptional regulator